MIAVRSILIRVAASVEIIIFLIYLIGGSRGVCVLRALHQQNKNLVQRMQVLKEEIQAMRVQVQDWKSIPYYKEQYAREHLQMARKDDEVYLL